MCAVAPIVPQPGYREGMKQPLTARSWTDIPGGTADIRLVACDMDGTLLDANGRIPDRLWDLLEQLPDRGITFVPASGRQYASLAGMFEQAAGELSFIAENGNLVVHKRQVISSNSLESGLVQEVIGMVRESDRHLGLVVCGLDSAYVELANPGFLAEARKYYARLQVVNDLTTVSDAILKLAIYDFDDAASAAETTLAEVAESHQVVVSGRNWVDIMSKGVDKGKALRALQAALGVSPAQTAAFGDYLNDLELLQAAEWSFAMENAHPNILAAARYVAPSNSELGVLQVLERLLDWGPSRG